LEPGLGDQPRDLDRRTLPDARRGDAGDLDRDQVGAVLAHDQELHGVERLTVLVGAGPLGLEVDHRLGRQRAQERDR
jgi:hypothetical protein